MSTADEARDLDGHGVVELVEAAHAVIRRQRLGHRGHERAHQPRPLARARRRDRGVRRRVEARHPQYRDYVLVNGILERVQEEIKDRFTTGVIKDIDKAGGRLDDMFAAWSVSRARDNAWTQAQTLAVIAGNDFLHKQFLDALGRNVGFAGRALLVPLG